MTGSPPRFSLPVLRDGQPAPRRVRRWRGWCLHLLRLCLFVALLLLIRQRHQQFQARRAARELEPVPMDRLRVFYPRAARTGPVDPSQRTQRVLDDQGNPLGFVMQTSPESDHIVGFSGPTSLLLAFTPDERVLGVAILSSRDTREHVALVQRDRHFLASWNGLTRDQAASFREIDAVSGATLTSLAIAESILARLNSPQHNRGQPDGPPAGGRSASSVEAGDPGPLTLRFPDPLAASELADWFPSAASVRRSRDRPGQYDVLSSDGQVIAHAFRTTPAADGIIGYQGPTDVLVALSPDGRVRGLSVRSSFDNEPYVSYVRDEAGFLELFHGRTVADLAAMDLQAEQVEGVSGATMTSLAIAEGLVSAARDLQRQAGSEAEGDAEDGAGTLAFRSGAPGAGRRWQPGVADVSAVLLVVVSVLLARTRLRAMRPLRTVFQIVLVVWLGFWCGALTSLAVLFGWAQNGIPWRFAFGLTVVTAAALLFPALSRTQLYCHHLCPHGALQRLVRHRLPVRWRPSGRLRMLLRLVPYGLLAGAVTATMLELPLSLVDLEPFDAYIVRAAGGATLAVFGTGLLAAVVTPMAYCRFGCPTGAVLEFLRFSSASDRWRCRDWLAAGLLAFAAVLWLLPLPPEEGMAAFVTVPDRVRAFVETNRQLLKWLAAGSVAVFLGSLFAVPWLVGLIPEDYFLAGHRPRTGFRDRHPAVAISLRILRNAAGAVFLLAGLAMLVLPGQGLLTILAGIVLLEFPGKRRLERSLIRRKPVLRTVNWIRRRRGRPEIRVD